MNDRQRERLRKYYEQQLRTLFKPERKPPSREVFEKRRHVWTHNSFFGFCKMAEKNMLMIVTSDSTTEGTKRTAEKIIHLLEKLYGELKERIDP